MNLTWQLDGWIIVAGVLCAVASALLGNFLVLRKLSMLGDAVSHAVLPGLAAAFFISHSRSSLPMFIGAVIVGIFTALFTEWIRRFGKVDEGASMGVVFTSLFALGLVMIVQAADQVDLDAGCVLYGAIELTPLDTVIVAGHEVPRAVVMLGVVVILNALFVALFFKELKLTAFDASLATSMGISSTWMHYALMILVAITAVASFESVGNILVVAMFIVPPATAYMLTDRLGSMVMLSVAIAAIGAVLGHLAAVNVPTWIGFRSTTTAAMMGVSVGMLFTIAVLFAPRHGIVVKFVRRQILTLSILADDIVGLLYRRHERQESHNAATKTFASELFASRLAVAVAMAQLKRLGQVRIADEVCQLTESGMQRATDLVRSHRLWEQYLVTEADMDTSRIHDKAERLEHFTDQPMRDDLDEQTHHPQRDPHGSVIPRDEGTSR